MKLRWHFVALASVTLSLLGTGSAVRGGERYLDFLEGLREREYYDYASLYLEQISSRPNLPPEIKEILPFEKAITLLKGVSTIRNPDEQSKQLDTARLFLEQFLKASPDHALAAQANAELAQVVLNKARVEITQSRSPTNAGNRAQFQAKARAYIAQARVVFQKAHDKYQAEWKSFPTFIDKTKDKEQFEARDKALVNYLQAQLNLAIVTYEEAQCYDKTAPEFKKLLVKASEEFEKIHSSYRSQVAGLFARMWQGKCFEEQDDITKALGIYNELLDHPGESKTMRALQDRVRHFRFICLNTDQRKDYQVVVQEATDWLKTAHSAKQTRTGLGIQWEQARAFEGLARKTDASPAEKERAASQALEVAKSINKYPGEYKEVSTAMIQRMMVLLNREAGDPKTFETAFGLSRNLITQISKKNEAVAAAKPPEAEKLRTDLQLHLKESARMLKLALTLATKKDDPADVNRARYWLAYVYYLQKDRNYDSAILGTYIARHYAATHSDLALDSAYLAMAAYMQAFLSAPEAERDADIPRVIEICNLITTKWPTNDKSNDARMNLGRLYSQVKQPAEAAKWFLQIPETAPQYLEAQLAAGQAYWQAFIDLSILPEDKRPPKAQLDEMQGKAQQILKDAITKLESKLPKDAPPVDNITAAKYSLVQILNGSGNYKEALVLLNDGPRSIVVAIKVDKEQDRPQRGIKSRGFAAASYRELLRAYVGQQQLDQARAAMKDLEKVEGAGAGGVDVTRIYLQLGKELEKEVKRLQAAKDPRLADVLKSFETFLDDIFKRAAGTDYNSLQWVAETYYALGEGLQDGDSTRADAYFTKAATALQAILDQSAKDPNFVPGNATTGVKLRLANCKRRLKSFDAAHELIADILKQKPRALDAQIEGAKIYQDWAAQGGPDDWKKWNVAVTGESRKKADRIWGWFDIGQQVARNLETSPTPNAEYEKQYLDARYNIALCHFKFAIAQPKADKKKDNLEVARRDITMTMSLSEDLGGGESWDRFNRLYREIQQEEGVASVVDLEKRTKRAPAAPGTKVAGAKTATKDLASADPEDAADTTAAKPVKAKKKDKVAKSGDKKKTAKASGGGMGMMALVGGVVLLVVGGGIYFMMQGKKGKKSKVEVPPDAVAVKKKVARSKAGPPAS